jgi:hypothetical protein
VVLETTKGAVPVDTVEVKAGAEIRLLDVMALVVVPATAGHVNVAVPEVEPYPVMTQAVVFSVPQVRELNVGSAEMLMTPVEAIAIGLVALNPAEPTFPIGMAVGRSATTRGLNDPIPPVAVACKTSVVVVSEFPPRMLVVTLGKVSVTAPDEAG